MRRTFVFAAAMLLAPPALAQVYRYEAETGQRFQTVIGNAVPGYSGTGYVTGFDSQTNSDYVELFVDVPNGLYEMWVGYRSPFGQKGYNYRVDSQLGSGMFEQSSTFSADRAGVFNVTGGVNRLGIYESWGFYDVDYLEFRPFTPPTVLPVSPQLNDPLADRNTQMLMNYMTSIYGQKTLAGHQHDESKNLPFPSSTYLNLSGGLRPALRSSDFMEYSPSRLAYGANPRNETEQSIAWAKQNGGVVSMTWHWNAPANLVNTPCGQSCGPNDYPWWRGFYTQGTTFDLAAALANPTGGDYQLILRDIDAIAVELKKFQAEDIPVIWRPLHEAQGNMPDGQAWFWWGADGPDAFKQLWRLMHDRLTNDHGLHNLIWEFTSSAARTGHLEWYPGDNVVDMVGLDIYTDPSSSMSGEWYDVLAHYNGRKMIALSESGTLPNADLMDLYDIAWSYFSLWKDGFLDDFTAQQVQALLNDDDIITLNELPVMPWSISAPMPGDYNDDGVVDAADYIVWRQSLGQTGMGLVADSNLDGRIDGADYEFWRSRFGQTAGSGSSVANSAVPEPASPMLLLLAAMCLRARAMAAATSRRP
ncbi:MAG: glycosyl hydrolase [Pirellulales bacterium]